MIDPTKSLATLFFRPFAIALLTAVASACGTHLTPTLVELAGRTVEIVETGEGPSTVVFESGFGDDWSPWDDVATEVARSARVFAYSRPGYGASEATTAPRDATTIVEDLRALLAARGYGPPYVLVGHSFGGTYMELFAKSYPQEVVGLVLVDPRHRDFTNACADAGLRGCTIPDSVVATLPRVQISEFEAFATATDEIDTRPFGPAPVRVLTATSHPWSGAVEDLWRAMLGALADEAEDGEQVIVVGAGHYLQTERPRRVAREIVDLLPRQ